ncbi:MAG: biosynthetic arginine decarboxylase [Gammaproteobacteria bacterium]
MSSQPKKQAAPAEWTVADSIELYRVQSWGEPYFFINEQGHVGIRALDEEGTTMDMVKIVAELRRRGVQFPFLIRFQDILRAQVRRINEAFRSAIAEANYGNEYRGIYPIKVNQLHEVVDELLDAGRPYGMGLECGSKAELIACLPQVDGDTLLVCNGVKDRTMLSLMISGQKIGQNIVPVMEKYSEFTDVKGLAFSTGFMSQLGVRVRLLTRGSGRWSESSGTNSKFGLNVSELMTMVNELEVGGNQQKLVLLHCHIGSQIADIQVLKQATKEVAQIYCALVKRGIGLKYLDVGGGLGVNYDKGHTDEDAGINYSLEEYANAVIFTVKEVCDANGVKTPVLVTESGRALTAHHSVLIVPVLGAHQKDDPNVPVPTVDENAAEPVHALNRIMTALPKTRKQSELLEAYHDANERLEEVRQLFTLGYLPIEHRALAENLYWDICTYLLRVLKRNPENSRPEIVELEDKLTDQYLCDFSVFQSMLDHWAIGQPFPILPIDRLGEQPERRAVLVDLTCDSDGKVVHYVSARDNRHLPLHTPRNGDPYLLGFFLTGAYEDIIGDAHNLFGRVSEAHVYADHEEPDNFWIEKIIPGMAVQDMLAQVQYFPNDLHRRMSELVRAKIQQNVVRPTQAMEILDQYMACFPQTTYCDTPIERETPR